jgi:hypothetical protein
MEEDLLEAMLELKAKVEMLLALAKLECQANLVVGLFANVGELLGSCLTLLQQEGKQ